MPNTQTARVVTLTSSACDYLYGEEWEELTQLDVHLGLSREPDAPKVYVTRLMARDGARLSDVVLQQGTLLVAGNGTSTREAAP